MAEGLQQLGNIKERLGARTLDHPLADVRECHHCLQARHIAKNYTQKRDGAANLNNKKIIVNRLNPLAVHKTGGHVCET